MRLTSRNIILLILAFFASTQAARANDQELYAPAPPPDAAYVRVLNAAGDAALSGEVGGAAFRGVAYPGFSPYRLLRSGAHEAGLGGAKAHLNAAAGKYYTLALVRAAGGKRAIQAFEDAPVADPAKAMVYFYNLSDAKEASLRAVRQETDIVSGVAPGASASRAVNALALDLEIRADGAAAASFPGVELKRRQGVSFMLAGEGKEWKAMMEVNKVEP